MGMKVFHHRKDKSKAKGGFTFGWTHVGDNLYMVKATCKDTETFSKKIGKNIVEGRLEKLLYTKNPKYGIILSYQTLVDKLLDYDLDKEIFPYLQREVAETLMRDVLGFDYYNQDFIKRTVLYSFDIFLEEEEEIIAEEPKASNQDISYEEEKQLAEDIFKVLQVSLKEQGFDFPNACCVIVK